MPSEKKRVIAFIDGFNFYHSIDQDPTLKPYKWSDLKKLVGIYVGSHEMLTEVYYFSALCNWDNEKRDRHKKYIKALKSTGVKIVLGRFKKKSTRCKICKGRYNTHEEKRTDVNIAIHLLQLAYEDFYDTAILMSGDTDLIPAITAMKRRFPEKKVGMLFPIKRVNEELKRAGDFSRNINRKVLPSCRFPDLIEKPDGTILTCPEEWK